MLEDSLRTTVRDIKNGDDYDVTANREHYFLINSLRAVESDPVLLDVGCKTATGLVDDLLVLYLAFDEERISDVISRNLLKYADIERTRLLLGNECCGPCNGLLKLEELLRRTTIIVRSYCVYTP